MSDHHVPEMNCANFMLPYPEEIAKKTGSSGMIFSIREHYLLHARHFEDTDPQWAAALREIADYYPDVDRGEIIESAKPDVFFNNPGHERTRAFLSQILNH